MNVLLKRLQEKLQQGPRVHTITRAILSDPNDNNSSIAVFKIDKKSITLQHINSGDIHPRHFIIMTNMQSSSSSSSSSLMLVAYMNTTTGRLSNTNTTNTNPCSPQPVHITIIIIIILIIKFLIFLC